jgi:hypothetical protein
LVGGSKIRFTRRFPQRGHIDPLATADINPTGRITVAELDRKLAASRLTTAERIQVKVALDRAGILA